MSLLSMVQSVATEIGLPKPAVVINSSDIQVLQLLALANTEGRSLARIYQWQKLIKLASFTMLTAELQGVMTTVAGSDYDYMIGDTMWDESDQEQVGGPISSRQWQLLQASVVSGPVPVFRIFGGSLYLTPAPGVANTLAFAYFSKNWCESSGGSGQAAWADDTDVGVLDEVLMALGLKWRWLNAKGLDYSEEFREYQIQANMAFGRDGSQRTLNLNGPKEEPAPGVGVPEGSWSP
jgi:hypothetical protein